MEETTQKTYGQQLVGSPIGHALIDEIRQKAAEYIDILAAAAECVITDDVASGQFATAIVEVQTSQMRTEMALTRYRNHKN